MIQTAKNGKSVLIFCNNHFYKNLLESHGTLLMPFSGNNLSDLINLLKFSPPQHHYTNYLNTSIPKLQHEIFV